MRILVASRRRFISIFIISARFELNDANALFNAIGTSETNRSKQFISAQNKTVRYELPLKSGVNGNETGNGLAMG